MSLDVKRQIAKVFDEHKKQAAFIIAKALTATVKDVQKDLQDEMKKVFNNPTPFTLNSLYIIPATKQKFKATVKIKDDGDKGGNAAADYLSPQIEGGKRKEKRSESRLRTIPGLGFSGFFIPGQGVKLNKYGNIPGPKMVQILSSLKAFKDLGYDANKTKSSIIKNPNQNKYFVITPYNKSHLKPGVYYRYGKGGTRIKPILVFTKNAPRYIKRFKFETIALKSFNKNFSKNIYESVKYAYSTNNR